MELKFCRRCRSGYQVDLEAGHKFCGFCGARVMSIGVAPEVFPGPYYLDSNQPIRISIRIANHGVSEARIDDIEIL